MWDKIRQAYGWFGHAGTFHDNLDPAVNQNFQFGHHRILVFENAEWVKGVQAGGRCFMLALWLRGYKSTA